jgi:hypothetical protein
MTLQAAGRCPGVVKKKLGDNSERGAVRSVEQCEHEGGSIEDVATRLWRSAGSLASAATTEPMARTTRKVASVERTSSRSLDSKGRRRAGKVERA